MLYIFDPDEKLIAILKPDFTRSTGPATTSRAFLSAAFPAEFDREPTEGCPYWDAKPREILNSENIFTFTVPADRADAAFIRADNLVAFKDLDAAWQFFEIKRLVDLHGDGLTRTAFCEHICYELLDDIVTDKRPSGSAPAALAGMLEGTRWQVGIVDDLGAASTNAYYISALEAVQKVAKAWQGELRWRVIISGGIITRYVDLLAMVGTDTGKQFAYSKDILSIEREEDISGIVTALYGRGKGIELDSGSYGRRLTFADIEAPDKPLGQEWIGDADALARWGRPGGRHRFDVFTDEEEEDPVKLLEKTRAELAKRKVPRVTYRLDVVSLEQLTGYEHEQVRLGDLVRVIDREFKPELVVSARVVEVERNLLAPESTKVVLGSFAPTIVDATINTARRIDDLANKPYNTKWLDGIIDVLQNAIENSQAYIWETPQGTLHMNAPTYEQATEAMLLGGGRFAIANQKDGQGGWNWRTFGDGSGFTGDLINAGQIRTNLVRIVSEDGSTFQDNSGFHSYDGPFSKNKLSINQATAEEGLFGFETIKNTAIVQDTSTCCQGSASLKITPAGTSAGEGIMFTRRNIYANAAYSFSFWYNFENSLDLSVYFKFYDMADIYISTSTERFFYGWRSPFSTPYWEQEKLENIIAPANAAKIEIYIVTSKTTNEVFWYDQGQLEEGAVASDFVVPLEPIRRASMGQYAFDKFGLELRDKTGAVTILDEDGIMQTWQDSWADNVDASHGLLLNVYLPTETKSIHKAILRFKLQKFRAYETAIAGGGSVNTTSGGGGETSTTSGGGGSVNTTSGDGGGKLYTAKGGGSYNTYYCSLSTSSDSGHSHDVKDHYHQVDLDDHYHSISLNDHYHSISLNDHYHSISLNDHVHPISYGIYESTSAASVTVKINGTDRTSALGGGAGFAGDQDGLDVSEYLTTGQWNAIELDSTQLGRIDASIFIQAKMGV